MMSVGEKYPKIRTIHSNSNLQEIDTATTPVHSPQPTFSPSSRNSSPGRYGEWHRTSFKVGKGKPSKTRYMKKSEVIGVILSGILSLVFALSIVALLYFGTPLVLDRVASALNLVFGTEPTAEGGTKLTVSRQSTKLATRLQEMKAMKAVENLSISSLKSKYINKQEPAVFTVHPHSSAGTTETTDAVASNTCHEKDLLIHLSTLQGEIIHLRSMRQFHQDGGNSSADVDYPLEDYLDVGHSVNTDLLEDKSYFVSSTKLASHLHVNMETSELRDASLRLLFSGEVVVSLGKETPQLSGTPFHMHKHTLNYLVSGRKHWVLCKYDKLPPVGFSPLHNLHSWLAASNDSSIYHEHVLHIFQEAGQYVFVPEGWYHATETLSLEGTVSVSYRAKQATAGSFLQYYLEGRERLRNGDFAGSIRMLKLGLGISRNVALLEQLAEAYIQSESFLAAEEVLREVIQWNPRHTLAYSKLISLWINHANRDISESISELLDQADGYGIRGDVLALSHDNL